MSGVATICAAEWAKASMSQRPNLRCEKRTAARVETSQLAVDAVHGDSDVDSSKCPHENRGVIERKRDWITK